MGANSGVELNKHERRFFSEHGEDGITLETLARIGVVNPLFVEFGIGMSMTANTTILAHDFGWRGLWQERDAAYCKELKKQLGKTFSPGMIAVKNAHLTAENIDGILHDFFSWRDDIGVMSVDVDGNDYWLWRAVERVKPRLVIIEYNASLGMGKSCAIKYAADHVWRRNVYHGASLRALAKLGDAKGYDLACCDMHGLNAFFVRRDVNDGKIPPATVEQVYFPHHSRTAKHSVDKQVKACERWEWEEI